jgi:hydroxymethylpyrimidine/phosphomethylpyrimidine kinase
MASAPPVVLSIAGFDPSSGAGVTADIKTIGAHHCYGITCITALTVQSTRGVRRVESVAPDLVQQTLEELVADTSPAAVHIGMLAAAPLVRVVAEFLEREKPPHVVLDPILKSSSGASLLEPAGVRVLVERLLPLADVLTPNLDEAAELAGVPVTDIEQMKAAAGRLHELGARAVVVTGGHLDPAADLLSYPGPSGLERQIFRSERIRSASTHGTGCAFATALACNLALGEALPEAVGRAKQYVTAAIANAYPLGKGAGPLNHLHEDENGERTAKKAQS